MRYSILNTAIDSFTLNETLKKITENIDNEDSVYQVSINANKINLMEEDARLKAIINNADFVNADGMSIIWAAKLLHIPIKNRITGVDLFYRLLEISEQKNYRIYFLGATQESLEEMVARLSNDHPTLEIAGYQNGYYSDEQKVVSDIKNSQPDILFLGFSSPKKEIWIESYKEELQIPFIMGVGGSFDIYSGKTKRAPKWIQNIGMEWFYRFIQEPIRMFDRYIIGNARFVQMVIKEKFK
ncbi:WecB/TagA/CpsF family glycosyltransferase [Enterococcus faecium EnGen0263]|uniref:WecB/TagA/CpsF family glycosyltransferase n=1 Tax=Enterococcus faecium TaxID=1352 RepID=UPI000330CF38|nr:WecB/TagA/CpsF family glycosyltransferase [Enterococcus faecium]EOH52847.1 WecB/TagA/CpsF family glycosyltransferase [Enterococcus faecium EnGen0263]